MLLPLATEPRTNMLNEIFTLLSDNQKECPPAQAFWESLHNTDRVRDFIPIPKDPKPKYHLEWTHKKGKRKPQQFWIYCEESQQNYVRVEFKASGFCWSQKSAVFIHKQTNSIVLIENFEEEDTQAIHRCLVCSLSGEETNFSVQHLPTNELERVAFSDLQIVFKIVADAEFPVHPHQGKPEEVRIHQNILHDKDLPFPFCYVGKFTFKNREEGWFRLEATLQYKEHEIFTGTSDLFMFNNPRMKKKKHLAAFEPAEIKFMQVYALNSCTDQDYWFDLGMQLGYGSTRCLQLLSLAPQMFSKVNSRSSSISIPSGMASSTVKFAANSKKRSSPHSLSGSPPRKMPCIEPTARKLSLPAMKLESSCASSNSFNEKKSNAKNFRRVISGPASSSLNPCNLDEFSSTVVPNILNSLAQCPTVDKVEHFEKSIYYQFLTEKLTLKDTNFSLLPCKSTLSIDQLIIRIAQQAKNNKVSHNGIRHLYARDHNTVVELTDTMDLHALFAREKNPVILVSTHDDENTPSRLLFSASTPSFRLRGR